MYMDYELYERLDFIVSVKGDIRPCWVCDEPTEFINIIFETHLHPGVCDWAATEAYFMALRGKDPWRENDGGSLSESSNTYAPPRQLT